MIVAATHVDWRFWIPVGIAALACFFAFRSWLNGRRSSKQQTEWLKEQRTAHFSSVAAYNGLGLPDDRLIEITNAGPAVARLCSAWLTDEDGDCVSAGGKLMVGTALPPGGEAVKIAFEITGFYQEGKLRLFMSWMDGNGYHEQDVTCPGLNPNPDP